MVYPHALQKLCLLLLFAYPSMQTPVPEATSSSKSRHWSYEDIQQWGQEFPTCNGYRQSPISLRTTTSYVLPLPPIIFGNYDSPLYGELTLTNNGHSVEIQVPPTTYGRVPFISGGIMNSTYEAVAFHFHWGSPGRKGSEHVIDNHRYDAELHIVHKNIRYARVSDAVEHQDGLAVLGIMFEIANVPDSYYPGLNKIFDKLPQVINSKSTATIKGQLALGQLLGDLNTKRFFTYSGSLTTPNCNEAVTWNVFPDPLPISLHHMEKFWAIRDSHSEPLVDNYRPLQNRNGRPVFYHIDDFESYNFI